METWLKAAREQAAKLGNLASSQVSFGGSLLVGKILNMCMYACCVCTDVHTFYVTDVLLWDPGDAGVCRSTGAGGCSAFRSPGEV